MGYCCIFKIRFNSRQVNTSARYEVAVKPVNNRCVFTLMEANGVQPTNVAQVMRGGYILVCKIGVKSISSVTISRMSNTLRICNCRHTFSFARTFINKLKQPGRYHLNFSFCSGARITALPQVQYCMAIRELISTLKLPFCSVCHVKIYYRENKILKCLKHLYRDKMVINIRPKYSFC